MIFFKKTKRHVSLDIHKTSYVKIKNLDFGATWSNKDNFKSLLVVRKDAYLNVKNKFRIFSGAKIYVNKNAKLIIGSGFINHNLNMSCFERIEIGEKVSISENLTIRDSDNHTILYGEGKSIMTQPIKIGNNVWIGINVTILKGVEIGDNVIVAAGSVVNKSFPNNVLIAGVPAKIINKNVKWE